MATFRSPSRALALGIAPSYPRALSDLTQLAAISERTEGNWPGAQTLVRELVTLPTHSRLRPDDPEEISEVLRSVAR
jgi:dTDP-4-amino-4,6-dideoxygalactose transaminase